MFGKMASENPYSKYSVKETVIENDDISNVINNAVMNGSLMEVKAFNEFISFPEIQCEKNDLDVSVWQQGGMYKRLKFLNEDHVYRFFTLLNQARQCSGTYQHWTEKQQSGDTTTPGCIMIDFDIYQESNDSKMTAGQMGRFQELIKNLICERYRPDVDRHNVYYVITRRSSLKFDEKRKLWKDGYHIYIYIRMTRNEKRYLVQQIKAQDIMRRAFGDVYSDKCDEFLDTQCVHVPTLLFGSCKEGSTPYQIWLVYQWEYTQGCCVSLPDTHFIQAEKHINFILELSVGFEGKVIKKHQWRVKDEYRPDLDKISKNVAKDPIEDREQLIDQLSLLKANDTQAEYIQEILECLSPARYNNHNYRFKVIFALISTNENYIPLAKWFFKKSHKYTDTKFEEIVKSVLNNPKKYTLNLESIYYWASKDKPERYKKCADNCITKTLVRFVYDPIIEGKLGHTHFAKIAYMLLKNKYRTDIKDGRTKTWYEFKMPPDRIEPGQYYKWVEMATPDNLKIALTERFDDITKKVLEYLNTGCEKAKRELAEHESADENTEREKVKVNFHKEIIKGYKASCRGLYQNAFKNAVISECESIFYEPGFARSLDRGAFDIGVSNGVLELNPNGAMPKLIKSYNTKRISMYTAVPYKEFDPKDPITRKLLCILRSMHPDDETDAFEYLMMAKASCLDNNNREAIFFMISGCGRNGKTLSMEYLSNCLGDKYCRPLPPDMILNTTKGGGEGASSFTMSLENARAGVYEESNAGDVLDLAKFKRNTGCAKIAARNLNERARTIELRCLQFAVTNHPYVIMTHEHAVWRRMRHYVYKMIFKDVNDPEYDPNNPFHRPLDRTIDQEKNQTEVLTAYLSILTFYYMKLRKYYKGYIDNIPHPSVERDTLEYRNREDYVNRFICDRIVINKECKDRVPLSDIVEVYCNWFVKNIKEIRINKDQVYTQFKESSLINEFEENGKYLRAGYKLIYREDDRSADDIPFDTVKKVNIGENPFKKENIDEFISRVEREYSELRTSSVNYDLSNTYTDEDYEFANELANELENDNENELVNELENDNVNAG